ncbi:unnamed protein product [Owenia fusiformis]|uniref:Nose resistant-to-fluoxetine protein N-terminal domain-containing protein n=1 Tax=Owenia fusiformis TaxID=6347 RepID=A0A8S4P532_OWEFU|nr:unnamed protein product [Owenia fusiformis]
MYLIYRILILLVYTFVIAETFTYQSHGTSRRQDGGSNNVFPGMEADLNNDGDVDIPQQASAGQQQHKQQQQQFRRQQQLLTNIISMSKYSYLLKQTQALKSNNHVLRTNPLINILRNVLPEDDIAKVLGGTPTANLHDMPQSEKAELQDADDGKEDLEKLLNSTIDAALELFLRLEYVITSMENITTTCKNDTLEFWSGLAEGKQWAFEMFDASGKPGGGILQGNINWFGNYDQCLAIQSVGPKSALFNGKFCTALVSIQDAPVSIYWGLCVPSSCSDVDLKILETDYLEVLGFKVKESHCDEQHSMWEDPSAVAGFVILCFFGFILISCTLIDIIVHNFGAYFKRKRQLAHMQPGVDNPVFTLTESNGDFGKSGSSAELMKNGNSFGSLQNESQQSVANSKGKDIFMKIVTSFSVYTNLPKVLNTSQGKGTLTCLNGVRFLSMSWVILGHTYIMGFILPAGPTTQNIAQAYKWTKGFWFQAIVNAVFSVDTFFVMSGILVTYLFLKQLDKLRGKLSAGMMGLFYFHRFWRLTPLYMMCVMIFATVFPYMGSGPFWNRQFDSPVSESIRPHNCRDNWWTNLLYINNIVNTRRMCIGHSWYLANDMQFFIISPLIIIPLYMYPLIGLIIWLVLFVAQFITTGILEHKNWMIGQTGENPDNFDWLFDLYMKPYCRIGAYLVGMLTGFILFHTHSKAKIKKVVVAAGWCLAVICCMSVLYGEYSKSRENGIRWSGDVEILYNTLKRPVWSIGVAWMMFACVNGYGGIVNTILSWGGWVPLSRLTFAAYLIHPTMMWIYVYNRRTPIFATQYTMVYMFFGHMVTSYAVALGLTLLFESPMMGLEKIFLPKPRK